MIYVCIKTCSPYFQTGMCTYVNNVAMEQSETVHIVSERVFRNVTTILGRYHMIKTL